MQDSNIHQDREEGKKEDLQLGGLRVWNKICDILESKDREIRHKSEANGKAWLGQSRPAIGCRTNDE
jgi:hypothetical protein